MKTRIAKFSRLDDQAARFDQTRFVAMTFMMTFQSCLGSIAGMSALHIENYVLLAICVIFTMASNTAFISQAPAKWCLRIFYMSVIANLSIIIISFL